VIRTELAIYLANRLKTEQSLFDLVSQYTNEPYNVYAGFDFDSFGGGVNYAHILCNVSEYSQQIESYNITLETSLMRNTTDNSFDIGITPDGVKYDNTILWSNRIVKEITDSIESYTADGYEIDGKIERGFKITRMKPLKVENGATEDIQEVILIDIERPKCKG